VQTRYLKILFAICAVALGAVPLAPEYLPLVDFPQHLALHTIWNNISDPNFNPGGRFIVNLATPYAFPNLVAHAAAHFLGPEGGLRFVLVVALLAFPLATLVLLRAFGRPDELALAAFPAALSFVYWFGFVTYVMSIPLVLLGVGLARRCASSGRYRDAALLAVVGMLAFATHGFAFLLLILLAGITALATTRDFPRLALVAAALAPGLLLSLAWVIASSSGLDGKQDLARNSEQPLATAYGSLRERLRYALASMFGSDTREPRVIATAAAFLSVALVAARWTRQAEPTAGEESGRRALAIVAIAAFGAAIACPQIWMNTWGLWERIPPIAFVAAVGALRWPAAGKLRTRLAVGLTAIALFSSGTALAQGFAFSEQARGIRELAQKLPAGRRVMWDPCGEERPWPTAVPSFKHLGSYVQAARGGDLSNSFAYVHIMVVHYQGKRLPFLFDRSVYDLLVLRVGRSCPPLNELRKLGPIAVEGPYVAFRAADVTPELADALIPSWYVRKPAAAGAKPPP
jgi:hypothetical protein